MNLETLQREVAAAVMMPLTSSSKMRKIARNGRKTAEIASEIIAPNSRLTAFERLEIYNRQYWFRVLDALREDFTALAAVLGEKRYHSVAVGYLADQPSTSFTLRNLGSKLVSWIAQHPGEVGSRYALALDVARLEWAQVEAFDRAEYRPMTVHEVQSLGGDSRIHLQPHLQLLELDHAVGDLVVALHREAENADADRSRPHKISRSASRRRKTWIAAHRVGGTVYYRKLKGEEYLLLKALESGRSLGSALEAAFQDSRIPDEKRAAAISSFFQSWTELGWLCQPNEAR